MALITDFDSLKAAATKYQWRTGDTEFTDELDGMIQMAGARLNRKLRLRVMEVDATSTGTIGSRLLGLPDDFLEPIALRLTTFGEPQELRASVAGQMPLHDTQAAPTQWCVNAGSIQFDTLLDQSHAFLFRYRKSFTLSDAVTTNWLIENYPDIYLAAVCVWGGTFMADMDEMGRFKGILEEGIEEIAWLDSRSVAIAPLGVDPALSSRSSFNITTG